MEASHSYSINLDPKFGPLEVIDLHAMAEACEDDWFNQTLCKVNESVVRVGIVQGEFHWHKHDAEDEFFFVVDGKLFIDLEDKTVELMPRQGFTIPRGVLRRPRAPERTVILMVEGDTVTPTGDSD